MKYFLLISLIASYATAKQTLAPMPVQASEKARFIYREFLANREDKFTIQATKCNPSAKNELGINRFDSKHKVVNGEVNTIHLYVRAGDCDTSEMNSVWSETFQIPKSKLMTQVFITILSSNVTVL